MTRDQAEKIVVTIGAAVLSTLHRTMSDEEKTTLLNEATDALLEAHPESELKGPILPGPPLNDLGGVLKAAAKEKDPETPKFTKLSTDPAHRAFEEWYMQKSKGKRPAVSDERAAFMAGAVWGRETFRPSEDEVEKAARRWFESKPPAYTVKEVWKAAVDWVFERLRLKENA